MERGDPCVIVGTSGWMDGVEGTIAGVTYGTGAHGVTRILGYMVQVGPFRGHYPPENVRSTTAYLAEHDGQIVEQLIRSTMLNYALDTHDEVLFHHYASRDEEVRREQAAT